MRVEEHVRKNSGGIQQVRKGARKACEKEVSRDRREKGRRGKHKTNYTGEERGVGKLRDVKEKEIEKCLKCTQKTQKIYRIKEYVMMVWYGSTMPGLVLVRRG